MTLPRPCITIEDVLEKVSATDGDATKQILQSKAKETIPEESATAIQRKMEIFATRMCKQKELSKRTNISRNVFSQFYFTMQRFFLFLNCAVLFE